MSPIYQTPGVKCPNRRREIKGMQYAKYNPMIAKLKMEFMAMVLTSMRRPSKREHKATKAAAGAGVLFFWRTRMKDEPGRP